MLFRSALNARNVALLLGAGDSSQLLSGAKVGIPTMAPLAKEFAAEENTGIPGFPSAQELC